MHQTRGIKQSGECETMASNGKEKEQMQRATEIEVSQLQMEKI